jgi:D-threo-aldose 1-dehydrogenase
MTPEMRREVGRTGFEIPVLGLGTCPLGGVYAAIGESEARATYEAAWNGGIRFFDTAPWYGLGQAEHRTGRALYDLPRGDYVLTTKVGRVLRAPRDRAGFVPPAWQAPSGF